MSNRQAVGVAAVVASVLAAVVVVGEGSVAAEPVATCTYRVSQHVGFPSGSAYGSITATDGAQFLAGTGFRATPVDPYPHGLVWHNGSLVADFGPLSSVAGVNRSGDAVGLRFNDAVVVPRGGQPLVLDAPAQQTRSVPWVDGITDTGLIIGHGRFDDGTVHGLSWSISSLGTVRDLGTAAIFAGVRDVGDNGEIVGAVRSGTRLRAVTGSASGFAPLGGVAPNLDSEATDIAGSYILGTGTIPGKAHGIVLWDNGVPSRLPGSGTGAAVNLNGDVVGFESVNGHSRPFLIRAGVRTPLPLLDGFTDAQALTITDDGRVAGWNSKGLLSQSIPVVWTCS